MCDTSKKMPDKYQMAADLKIIEGFKKAIANNSDYIVHDGIYLRLCAAVDRIGDIIKGLNNKQIVKKPGETAFDFYEYLSQSFVMLDAIFAISDILTNKSCPCNSCLIA